ncbi:MAG: N-acetyltransferase, partial [bacterium]|nr:N-acetyltransferase [bacterium]
MSIEIRKVETKKDLKAFIKMPFGIYKGNDMWVPPIISEEMETFNPKKNPAYEAAETRLFIAYKDGKPAGRIAGVLSHAANKKYTTKNMRFGWFDSIDDLEVSRALFDSVEAWAKETGMETLTGPHGFCDLDQQGMLIEGFDQL